MAMPKIWAAFERLTSADLNAAFEWLRARNEPLSGAQAHGGSVSGTAVLCDLSVLDRGNAATLNAANDRFVVPAKSGLYRISVVATAANTATGERHILSILVGGVSVGTGYAFPNVTGGIGFAFSVDVYLGGGEFITFTGTSSVTADWSIQSALIYRLAAGLA